MGELLFLSHRIPYPPNKGEKIRAFHFFEHLARSHRIHLGCLIDDEADWAHVPALRAMCADLHCARLEKRGARMKAALRLHPGRSLTYDYFHDAALQRWVDGKRASGALAGSFVFSSGMARYVFGEQGAPTVLDMVDIDSEKWAQLAREAGFPARHVWAREGRTLLRLERRAAAAFARTLFVSPAECDRFAALAPECRERITWVENGVDLDRFSPAGSHADPYPSAAPRIVFTGTMDYWPNADAMTWFVREVMPILRARAAPGSSPILAVVGANPGPDLRALAGPDVIVTGRVDDVRPWVAHAGVAVAPLRVARGIQNKVLEAMAMARPVVASPQAFEGVRAEPGRDLLVADGAEATAASVADVLDGAHPALGAAGRAAVERAYAWPATLARLDQIMADAGIAARAEGTA